jgi:hypothetical protein
MANHCTHSFRRITNIHQWKHKPALHTYRFQCKCCGHRWNVYFDRTTKKEIQVSLKDFPNNRRRFTPAEIKKILEDWRFDHTLAKAMDVPLQTITSIRTGRTYKDLCPEIPRRGIKQRQQQGNGCVKCKHWHKDTCDFDIPEAGEAGFFTECSLFSE